MLFTSELANLRVRKALFTCVVYTIISTIAFFSTRKKVNPLGRAFHFAWRKPEKVYMPWLNCVQSAMTWIWISPTSAVFVKFESFLLNHVPWTHLSRGVVEFTKLTRWNCNILMIVGQTSLVPNAKRMVVLMWKDLEGWNYTTIKVMSSE